MFLYFQRTYLYLVGESIEKLFKSNCYGRGFLTPCNEGEGGGGNGSVAFVSFEGVGEGGSVGGLSVEGRHRCIKIHFFILINTTK